VQKVCGRREIWWENLREEDHLEDVGVDMKIILKLIKKWDGGMNWIDLAEDRNRWRALVNAAMNLRVPENAKNFLTSSVPVRFSRRSLIHGVKIKNYFHVTKELQCSL
jgi:hypothetical protein